MKDPEVTYGCSTNRQGKTNNWTCTHHIKWDEDVVHLASYSPSTDPPLDQGVVALWITELLESPMHPRQWTTWKEIFSVLDEHHPINLPTEDEVREAIKATQRLLESMK